MFQSKQYNAELPTYTGRGEKNYASESEFYNKS